MALREETLAEYTVLAIRMPPTADPWRDLEWICRSFGFLKSRDKQKTAYGIFRALVEAARRNEGLTSDELAEKLGLTRGTMVHHLNKMIKSGLVIHHEGQYKLRGRNIKSTLEEVQRDIRRVFEDLYKVAETVDKKLNFSFR